MATVRNIIVTGANRGLGHELIKQLLNKGGYRIIATARHWNDASRSSLTASLSSSSTDPNSSTSSSSKINFIELDITNETSRTKAVKEVRAILSPQEPVHILVNNAGVFPQSWSPDDFRYAWETNTVGPLRFAEAILPCMLPPSSSTSTSSSSVPFVPHIINVSSGLGKLSQISSFYQQLLESCTTIDTLLTKITYDIGKHDKFMQKGYAPSYCLSKAALNRGTQLLAKLYKGQLRATSVDPGWCSTDMGTSSAPRTPQEGATSILNAVMDEKGGLDPGQYLSSNGVPMGW